MDKTKIYLASAKDLEDKALFQKLYHTVSDIRQNKIDSLLLEKDKRLSLAAELLLKKALSDCGIDSFELEYGENGKPYIKDHNDIFFNLSHSNEMVMCAVSSDEVGCDTEKIKDIDLKIAKRFFSESEYNLIIGNEKKNDMFFRIWTLKESFMKATGLGMKLPMNSFTISIENSSVSVSHNLNNKSYFFKEFDLKNGYKYAVCTLASEIENPQIVSFNELNIP